MVGAGVGAGLGHEVGAELGTNVGEGLGKAVGDGDGKKLGVRVGGDVLLGQLAMLSTCSTPHDVDAHRVLRNALYRSTPFNTHQSLRSWLKAEASLNMFLMLPTPEVSHAPMSSLKDDFPRNNSPMFVTPPVFHAEMWPYVTSAAAASASQDGLISAPTGTSVVSVWLASADRPRAEA